MRNSVNQELRRLACVRSDSIKLKLVLKGQELRGKSDRSLAVAKRRLCSTCKEQEIRSFLRKGICEICVKETPAL